MSNYQRLISYIYAYEGGVKGKNIGFAKLETRGNQCRIMVNVKKIYIGGNPIGVYLLTGEREVRIGTLFARNGVGEFRTVVNVRNVEESGCSLDECFGLSVHDTESAWRCYTTIWEDAVTQAAEVELAKVTAERAEERRRREKKEQTGRGEALPISREIEKELESEELERLGIVRIKEKEPRPRELLYFGMNPEEVGKKKEPENREMEDREPENREMENREPEDREPENRGPEDRPEEKRASEEEGMEEVLPGDEMAGREAPLERELSEEPGADGLEPEEAEAAEPGSEEEEAIEPEPEEAEAAELGSEEEEAIELEPEEGEAAGRTPTASIPSPFRKDEESQGEQELWKMLQSRYPKLMAFDYADGCEILMIKPQDIGLLPRENWVFGSNSFLLHGYYYYRYLILARLNQPGGRGRYLLGVPGHYRSSEKYMASMFGFPDFVLSKNQPPKDSRFGYWYTDIKLGE